MTIKKRQKKEKAVFVCSLTMSTEVGGGQQNKKATVIQRDCESLNHNYKVCQKCDRFIIILAFLNIVIESVSDTIKRKLTTLLALIS